MYAGLAPHDALAIYAVIAYLDSVAGVFFPRGGMHAVPRALAGAAEKHGVRFRYDTRWSRSRPRTAGRPGSSPSDGERIPADVVVLNPDLPVAYRDLLPPAAAPRGCATRRPAWCCTSARRQRYRKIAHHNIHFGRRGGGTFDEVIRQRRADERPVVAGHQPDAHRPVAGAGRAADLLRARPDAQPRRRPARLARRARRRYADELIGDAGAARLHRFRGRASRCSG